MADENTPLSTPHPSAEGVALDNAVLRIDKGRVSPPSHLEQESRTPRPEPDHIPWGYGRDRIAAMVVDPNRLYLYWELTDLAIEKARQDLGPGGKDAWLSLRVYDTTGRIFDGMNSHGYFDIKVDRSDRQWFIHIGKPASTHVIELGLKSFEGYFVKIVRSGRADFPRFEPSPDGTVEWLTVRAGGPVGGPAPGALPGAGSPNGVASGGAAPGGPGAARVEVGLAGGLKEAGAGEGVSLSWQELGQLGVEIREWSWTGWDQLLRREWVEGHRFVEWKEPLSRTTWEAGPFELPVDPPTLSEERFEGPVTVYPLPDGRTRVVYGPWEVVIRGIGAKAEARMVSKWKLEASWVVSVGFERVVREASAGALGAPGVSMLGGSEAVGASERRWLSASDLRLRGASELYLLGASELRLRGASEVLLAGSSERRMLGATERMLSGASEYRFGGASERLGASEKHLGSSDLYAGSSDEAPSSPYAFDGSEHASHGRG